MKTARNEFWEWWQQCRAECEKFRHTVKLVAIQIPYYSDFYGYQFKYYGTCMTTSLNIFYPVMSKSTWLGQLTCLSEFEFTNKNARFSWFWVLFVIKQWSRVEVSSPNTSTVGLHGWYNWRGCQNLNLMCVSKKNERKFSKIACFSWFWALFLIKQWSRVEGGSLITLGAGSHGWYNWRGCQNLS